MVRAGLCGQRGGASACVYYLVINALQRKDEEIILSKLKEYAAMYVAGGLPAVQSVATQENNPADERSFYVNLITKRYSNPIFIPDGWMASKSGPDTWRCSKI